MCLYLSTRRFLILFTIYSDIVVYHGGIPKYTNYDFRSVAEGMEWNGMVWMCLYLFTRRFLILFTVYIDILIYHGSIPKYSTIVWMNDVSLAVYF